MKAQSLEPVVLPPKDREAMIGGLAKVLLSVFPGKPVRVSVCIARPDKTPKQNKYLWAVPYKMLSIATGMESEEIHEWNCGLQWGWHDRKCPVKPSNPMGVISEPIRSTTRNERGEPDNCSSEEMKELWSRAQRLGATLGLVIPDPDPDYIREWKKAERK